ncbi:hypothetical protein [Mycobacterium leprae]|uniref:hypothetical protein n=2 Tax=Mycobacterium leprae TaxID=1769 RepID=UPI000ABEE209|nr:hypothetical protein [Mycobacterium leprae]
MIAMPGIGDPDTFPASNLGFRLAAQRLGLPLDERTTHRAQRTLAFLWPPNTSGPHPSSIQ